MVVSRYLLFPFLISTLIFSSRGVSLVIQVDLAMLFVEIMLEKP